MIIEVEGDILLSKAQAIAHGVAANDPMSQGLAKSLHEWMPSMHKDFHRWCHKQRSFSMTAENIPVSKGVKPNNTDNRPDGINCDAQYTSNMEP